jgi:hypothetical protein
VLLVLLCVACSGSGKKPVLLPTTTTSATSTTAAVSSSTTTSTSSTTSTTRPATTTTSVKTSVQATTTTAAHRAPKTTYLTYKDNGSQVAGIVGDTFEVGLIACGNCGSRWVVTGIPAADTVAYEGEQDSTSPTSAGPTSTTAAQVRVQTFTFKAVGPHSTGLVIGYYAQGSTTASQTFSVTFHISAS